MLSSETYSAARKSRGKVSRVWEAKKCEGSVKNARKQTIFARFLPDFGGYLEGKEMCSQTSPKLSM